MHRPLITLLLTLGLCSGAQAAILGFDSIDATIIGSASTVDVSGNLDADDFSDVRPPTDLPLFGDAFASTPAGSIAASSAFVDEGFIFIDTDVFDLDESAEASARADFNARFTGTGGIVTLFLDVDHQADAVGLGASTATELLVQVIGPGGLTLVDLLLPLGAVNMLSMFDPTFSLAAGAFADLAVSVFGESASALGGSAFSLTSVEFRLDAAAANAVDATPTLALSLLAVGAVWGSRRRRPVR